MRILVLVAISAVAFIAWLVPTWRRANAPLWQHVPGDAEDIRRKSDRSAIIGFAVLTGGIFLLLFSHITQVGIVGKSGAVMVLALGGIMVLVSAIRRRVADLRAPGESSSPPPVSDASQVEDERPEV